MAAHQHANVTPGKAENVENAEDQGDPMRRALLAVGALALASAGCTTASDGTRAQDAGKIDGGENDAGGIGDGGQPDGGRPGDFDGGCPAVLTWGNSGGFSAYSESSEVATCAGFTLTRTPEGNPDAGGACQAELDATQVSQLESALANADVVAAFNAAPVLYGIDPRPVDGVVFEVSADGRVVDVGTACGGESGCVDAPAGVTALETELQNLTEQVRASEPSCAPLR